MKINLSEWKKEKKSTANILGWQPKFDLLKMLFRIIEDFTNLSGGILKSKLYQIIYGGNLKPGDDIKSFDNSIKFLCQINLIDMFKKENEFYYKKSPNTFDDLNFEMRFFNSIKELKDLLKSPYILYEQLIRNNYTKINRQKLSEFSTSIKNRPEFKAFYNVNPQQINPWTNLFENLGAIFILGSELHIIPDYQNCFFIFKSLITNTEGIGESQLKLETLIQFYESNFYPILLKGKESRNLHPWFIQFIKTLNGRKIVKLISKGDAIHYNIGNSLISNLEILDKGLLEGGENV